MERDDCQCEGEKLYGKLEGIKDEKYSIAKSLKSSGIDNKFISKHTGLTIDEIEKL